MNQWRDIAKTRRQGSLWQSVVFACVPILIAATFALCRSCSYGDFNGVVLPVAIGFLAIGIGVIAAINWRKDYHGQQRELDNINALDTKIRNRI